jgi:hypothetical protein
MKANGSSIKAIARECGIARATVCSILSRVAESGCATSFFCQERRHWHVNQRWSPAQNHCSIGIIAALYVVGFVSQGIIRHMVQTAPEWLVLALAARGSRWTKWAALPCAAVWLLLMALIWLFLLGWAHVISGTFSSIEVAMTIVVGACSIVVIAQALRMRSAMSATSAAGILLLLLVLQLVALRVSFLPSVERDPWARPRRQIGAATLPPRVPLSEKTDCCVTRLDG